MSEVLDKVPLDRETKAVLLGQSSMLRPVCQLTTGLHLDHGEVASLHWPAQQWAPRSQHRCMIVYFRLLRGISRFPGFGFEPCGCVLLCKTFHALPLALSGANEYH